MKRKTLDTAYGVHLHYYPVRYGGYWSVIVPSGSETYFPSEEEARHYYDQRVVDKQKANPEPLDDGGV